MDSFQETLTIIDGITSVTDVEELQKLEAALDTLFQSSYPERGVETLFHLYERFPDDDGYGVFWTVLHGIERLPGYEPYLTESVQRVPMEFNLLMVNRLLNSDLPDKQRQDWLALLGEVVNNPGHTETVKEMAQHYIEFQADRLLKESAER